MMKKVMCVLMFVGLVSMASGALSITNGDFESGIIGFQNTADVPGWYDSDADAYWATPWIKYDNDSHNGTAVVLMSCADSGKFGPAIGMPGKLDFVYQSIGTADGAEEVTIGFETGVPFDGPADLPGRDYGITFTIVKSDGTFVAGEEVDVLGAAGTTVIAQQTKLYTNKLKGDIETEEWTFDLSNAGDDELFLRFNHYSGANQDPWIGVDNIAIVPEPATMVLLGLGGLSMLRRRRRA